MRTQEEEKIRKIENSSFIFCNKGLMIMSHWFEVYGSEQMPSIDDMKDYIGEGAFLWLDLHSYMEEVYQVKPKIAYSKCSAQPGWNVKYQKSGKSLCTLYPVDGYFIALVVIGAKEDEVMETSLTELTPYIVGLYHKTAFSCGGRWLMIEVTDLDILRDIKKLMAIRVKPKKVPNF